MMPAHSWTQVFLFFLFPVTIFHLLSFVHLSWLDHFKNQQYVWSTPTPTPSQGLSLHSNETIHGYSYYVAFFAVESILFPKFVFQVPIATLLSLWDIMHSEKLFHFATSLIMYDTSIYLNIDHPESTSWEHHLKIEIQNIKLSFSYNLLRVSHVK